MIVTEFDDTAHRTYRETLLWMMVMFSWLGNLDRNER